MRGFLKPPSPRDQILLFARRLDDAVAAGHPVRLFDEALNSGPFSACPSPGFFVPGFLGS